MKSESILFLAVLIPAFQAGSILFNSRLASNIIFSNGNKVTTVVSSNIGPVLATVDSQSKLVWDAACATSLSFKELITIPCGYDITYFIHTSADVSFDDHSVLKSGEITQSNTASNLETVCDAPFPLGFSFSTVACVPGSTGVAYSAYLTPGTTQPACPPGCSTCSSDWLTCTACDQHSYRVAVPDGTGHCPCLPSFYLQPTTKVCFACPLNLYCKTCALDAATSSPVCTSCNCAHHRVFNPATNRCDCDSTHHQDGANSYCVLTAAP